VSLNRRRTFILIQKKMTKSISVLFFIILSLLLNAQDYQITWQNCFGGSEIDYAMDIVMVNDNYLITGICTSDDGDITFTHGNGDGWVIMIDSTGNILWQRNYGGSLGDWFVKIVPTDKDEFYLIGLSGSSDYEISYDPYPGSYDYWIVKIDLQGNIIWDRIIGGNFGETIWSGFGTSDGGVVAYGWTDSDDGDVSQYYGLSDAWMIKLSSEGEIEWDYTIGTDWVDVCQAAMQTSDGGYLIASNSNMLGNNTGNITCTPHSYGWNEAVLFKLDSNLNLEWQQCYGGSDHDGITTLMEVSDGYIFVAYTGSNDGDVSGWHGDDDIWIVKIDYNGNIVWQNALGGSNGDGLGTLTQLSNGDIVSFAATSSNNGDVSGNHSMSEYDHDIWFVKLSSEGELLYQQCIGGAGSEELYFGVVQKNDNNFVIAGQTNYGPSYDVQCDPHGEYPDKDFWVFEIKDCSQYTPAIPQTPVGSDTVCNQSSGPYTYTINPASLAWDYEWQLQPAIAGTLTAETLTAEINWSENYTGTAAIITRSHNDCGYSEWSQPKYLQVNNCLRIAETDESKIFVYPNPAKNLVQFEVQSSKFEVGELRLFDVFGRQVASKQITPDQTVLDMSGLPDGVYYYRVVLGEITYSGKIVIQR
jgi:hypothetical protein